MLEKIFADTAFVNGKIITVSKEDTIAEAVCTKGNKILYVGSNKGVEDYIGKSTRIIDAGGKTIMPGFIDSHIHFVMYGLLDHGIINVDYKHINSIQDIIMLIQKEAARKKPGEWIVLSGYDHNKLAEKRHPLKEEFDKAAPKNPVQCIRCCAHMGVYNSYALKLCNVISPEQFAPGEVVVNENGNLTGLLKETAHMSLSKQVVVADEELMKGLENANAIMLKNGITSVHDAGSYGKTAMRLLQKVCAEKKIQVRIRPMIFDMYGKESGKEYIEDFLKTGIHTNLGDEHYKIGPIKIMTDGSTSGPSCATIQPYCHDKNLKGIQVWQQEETDELVKRVHQSGFQMTAHAVGDKAVTLMLDSYEKALKYEPRENHRHRIEHCALTSESIIQRVKDYSIVPVSNPAFISINACDYNRFYGDRVNYMFPLKDYLDKGIITAIGSDAPVTEANPMFGIYGAVNRCDIKTQEVCGANQKVNVLDIIRMFTFNGAYAAFEEEIKGSLETGKLADIIMLSEDILKYPKEDLMNVKVELTMVDGKIVYEA
ncbi:MAG: amidohydrolase [Lachnospiraceae bacterium]|nr:amidohydrolase [Lachnospiraceae bacterium]